MSLQKQLQALLWALSQTFALSPSGVEGLQKDVCPAHANQGKHQLMSDGGATDAGTWQASLPSRSYSQLQITFVTALLCRGKVETPKQTNECGQSHGVHESKPKLPSPRASTHHGLLSRAAAGRGHGKLTRSVSTGEAFASLSHYARVACAHQLCVRSSVREASIEEVRPWPRAENKARSPQACSAPSTVLRRDLSTQPSHGAPTYECGCQLPCTAPLVVQREGGVTQVVRNAKLSITPSSAPAWAGRAQQTRARLQQHTLTSPPLLGKTRFRP